ncbi:glycoside hydrolase family 3 protein [Streptomyces yaanensis]|uniref:Glycoside hydrolase family 3 protein n=1 Tax=Streptomyces yaanensis TaxID=1142239 RepID=A0ABV7S5T7_9ACTN|nr:glycoside hydrolase family 3 N-terminal domain-containing protein [Streptomyces sp. CGMCC 4.7035]WNB99472.1 glycoside hydrolase family 3 N-terminal domain-containing protein [Streptomyces sp. CGMCC 4.7035]
MTTFVTGTDALTRDALAVLQPGFAGTTAPDWVRRRLGEGLASVALFGRNVEDAAQVTALTAQLRAERDDLLVAIDEESGDVTRIEVRTGSSFPGNHALGAVDDTGLTRGVARELGRRLAGCGVNFDWAPSADVNVNPDNPVIGVRSFGADTDLVARHTAAYVEGLQSMGVAACTKHFPGHGDTSVDSHHAIPRIDVDTATLYERELPPFRAAIAAGTRALMSAHILVPALDPERPATLSHRILTEMVRGELGYEGLIVTDGMEMRAISGTYGLERGVVLAIAAGADAICVGGGLCDEGTVLSLRDALVTAVRSGELPEERLADAAARVRDLARWTAEAARDAEAAGASDPEIGLVAARRAVTVTRTAAPAPVTEPVYVATFDPVANIAVGDETPWGVGAELERLLPGTTTGSFTGTDAGSTALAAAGDRRIVAVVRDEHRHEWMRSALDMLLAARPDTIVVEMGVPQSPPRGALHLATYGAARVCGVAAAERIVAG